MNQNTCEILNLSHDARGIARIDGKTTFISNALRAEVVEFELTKTRAKFNEAFAKKIIKPSNQRIEPECKHFGECGGCSLQHLHQDDQLKHKQEVVLELLKHIGQTTPKKILPAIKTNPFAYRNKARYSIGFFNERWCLGFKKIYDPTAMVEISECKILSEPLQKLIEPLENLINQLQNPENIFHLDVACDEKNCFIDFNLKNNFSLNDQILIKNFSEKNFLEINFSIENDRKQKKISSHLQLPIEKNLSLQFSPKDFFQINFVVNKKMIQQAITWLELNKNDHVLDLFCGLGNFTLPIAKRVEKVFGVEGSNDLVKRAKFNAKINQIDNANFVRGDLNFCENIFAKKEFVNVNKILIDPPRAGAKALMKEVIPKNIERIVYVSCNPSTLARDLKSLVAQGFSFDELVLLDMFTHTKHVEAMALLTR